MTYRRIDLHVHTDYSKGLRTWESKDLEYCQRGKPEEVIRTVEKRGLDGILVVDINNLGGAKRTVEVSKQLKRYNKLKDSFQVYIGEEIETPLGDVIVVYSRDSQPEQIGPYCPGNWKKFSTGDLCELFEKVAKQSGIIIAPHPFVNGKSNVKERTPIALGNIIFENGVKEGITGVEAWNARLYGYPIFGNKVRKRTELKLEQTNFAKTAGSDNLDSNGVGLAYTLFETEDIFSDLKKKRTIINVAEYRVPSLWSYVKTINLNRLRHARRNLMP